MNAFMDASNIEARAMIDIIPFIERRFPDRVPVSTQHQLLLQKYAGDLIILSNGTAKTIELKAEEYNRHGNFFLEAWSNKSRYTQGWMFTTRANWIWYYFIASRELYHLDVSELRKWAFESGESKGKIYAYPERKQGKRDQLNDTWGWCVPINILREQLKGFSGPIDPTIDDAIGAINETEELICIPEDIFDD